MEILNGLQFSPFEWTMSKACGSSPMEFSIRLICAGVLSREKFEQAIAIALKTQPMLQANAVIGPTHRLSHWRPAGNVKPKIFWMETDSALETQIPDDFESIDLSTEIGFRLYGYRYLDGEKQECNELNFLFHHVCCDGKGAIGFITQVLHAYESLSNQPNPSPPPLVRVDDILLRTPEPPKTLRLAGRLRKSFLISPKRFLTATFRKPASISLDFENSADSNFYNAAPRQCSLALDIKTTRQLGLFSNRQQTTSNNVLICELFRTLDHFLRDSCRNKSNRQRPIRIFIPFSLRDSNQQHMPAANCVSMTFLEASAERLASKNLLEHVTCRIGLIRKWQLHYGWAQAAKSYARAWPLFRMFKSRRNVATTQHPEKKIATSVLSNLGSVFKTAKLPTEQGQVRIGDLLIRSVHLALPCTAAMPATFSVNFYAGRLNLDVTYLPSVVSKADAQKLLDGWRDNILKVLG